MNYCTLKFAFFSLFLQKKKKCFSVSRHKNIISPKNNRIRKEIKRKIIDLKMYSGDPNARQVHYSNGKRLADRWMLVF